MKISTTRGAAFSLVEVTLALGVASFCLIAIFGLLPVGLNSNAAAIQQTQAAGIAAGLVADLRLAVSPAVPPPTPTPVPPATPAFYTSPFYGLIIPKTGTATHVIYLLADGSAAGALDTPASANPNALYRATLVFTVPPAATSYYSTVAVTAAVGTATAVRVLITWPAAADYDYTVAPKNFSGSFETVTVLPPP